MRFARRDVRGHVASQKNDHGASYPRYRALQRRSRPNINVCEISGVVRFSTFATLSAKSGLVRRSKLSDYPISSSASESGSAEVAMHYAFAACD